MEAQSCQASSGFWVLLGTILASSMAFIDGSALRLLIRRDSLLKVQGD